MVEQRFRKAWVVGSIPTVGSSFYIGNGTGVLPDSCQIAPEADESRLAEPVTMTKAGTPRKKLNLSLKAARLGVQVRKVTNRSRGTAFGYSWLVTIPGKVTGGLRLRRQFKAGESKQAVNFAEGAAAKAKEQGQTAFYLTPEQVTDAKRAFARLSGLGLTLTAAAEYAAKHLRPEGGDKTLAQVRDTLIERKEKKGLRPASLHGLKVYCGMLVDNFGENTFVKSISGAQLSAWVDSYSETGASPRHVRNLVAYVNQFFRFAESEKFVAQNPAAHLGKDATIEDEREIVVLSVPEVKNLLKTAMQTAYRDLLPATVLGLFCGGIRTEELHRLKWSDVDLTGCKVRLQGKQTKTRDKRTCEIPPCALSFLMLHPNRSGQIAPKRFRQRLTAFHKAAGFPAWKKTHANSKRHSFGSYESKLHDWEWVVSQMGNSVSMLLKHYRDARVTKEDAQEFFSLKPTSVGAGDLGEVVPIEQGA